MNNENNNNINNVPVTPTNDKFMPVTDVNQINQPVQPQVVPVEPQMVQPSVQPVIVQATVAPTVQPVYQAPTVNPGVVATPQPTTVPQPQLVTDNNTMVNENLKKVEIKDYKAPSKFKVFLLIVFFIALVAFIIFLPDISSMISIYMSGANNKPEEIITTGKLICTVDTSTSELDKENEFTFTFEDSKLKKFKYISTVKGDSTSETSLDELAEKCNNLKKETNDLDGFYIRCDYMEKELTETQNINLDTIDTEKLGAAFTEAGGILPTYTYDQNIDDIEKEMKLSNYLCIREK